MGKKENVIFLNITKVNPTDPESEQYEVNVDATIIGAEPKYFELAADSNIMYYPEIGYGVRNGRLHCVKTGNNKKFDFDTSVIVERNLSQEELIVHVDYAIYDNEAEIMKLSEQSFQGENVFLFGGPGNGGGSGSYEP